MNEFDFIIIGSGSAGGVLADRLSKDPRNSVLLLEAGPKPRNPALGIPLAGPALAVGNERLDWRYTAQEDPACPGRRHDWPRGRMLGGSSRLNGMVYVRGARRDFDGWADAGCAGWSWEDVIPHFRALEAMQNPVDGEVLGIQGQHKLHRLHRPHPLAHAFIEAHELIGYPGNPHYNSGEQTGAAILVSSSDGWRRSSSVSGFLSGAMRRRNLKVETDALVSHLELHEARAVAVNYRRGGAHASAKARRQIILCAGTIGSPAILMRSGIGPPDHLNKLGIEVTCANAAVGQNLHEHPAVQLVARSRLPTVSSQNRVRHVPGHLLDWLQYRGGLLAAATYEAISFVRSGPQVSHSDLQMHFAPYGLIRDRGKLRPHSQDSYMIQVNASYPESRGQITLASPDLQDAPIIYANMLSAAADQDTLSVGVETAMTMMQSAPFAGHFDGFLSPNGAKLSGRSPKDWIASAAVPSYHPAGTCKMGSGADAVVDPQLRVIGVEGLSVADASIMPAPISGNIQAAVMMIGERAAAQILT